MQKIKCFEAIRWVMGESSSKSLRSSSMDEVIFNGTQQVPAKNFAEVSIELDNFDGVLPGNISNEKGCYYKNLRKGGWVIL